MKKFTGDWVTHGTSKGQFLARSFQAVCSTKSMQTTFLFNGIRRWLSFPLHFTFPALFLCAAFLPRTIHSPSLERTETNELETRRVERGSRGFYPSTWLMTPPRVSSLWTVGKIASMRVCSRPCASQTGNGGCGGWSSAGWPGFSIRESAFFAKQRALQSQTAWRSFWYACTAFVEIEVTARGSWNCWKWAMLHY